MSKGQRPSRPELVSKFFPEISKGIGATTGDKEATIGINTRATEAILQDFIGLFDAASAAQGPGVLAIRLAPDAARTSTYLTVDDLQADADLADRTGNTALHTALADTVSLVSSFNTEKAVLLLLIDSGFRLFPIDRDNPARSITAMMEEQIA